MTIHWKAVEQYLSLLLFVFQLKPVCNFGKFNNSARDVALSEVIGLLMQSLLAAPTLAPRVDLTFQLSNKSAFSVSSSFIIQNVSVLSEEYEGLISTFRSQLPIFQTFVYFF